MRTIKKGAGIQSLELGLSILEFVNSRGRALSFTEIQEGTQITKSNLYKYLHTLTTLGFLHRDKFNGSYSLGSKLIEYGMSAVNQENVVETVAPYLQEISKVCRETVLLSVWTYSGPMIIRMINSNQTLNIGAQIGSYLPLQSATGEIFAAYMDNYQIRDWIDKELAGADKQERERILQELQEIRDSGMTYRNGSLVPSISAVAAPIFNYKSKVLGVISLVGFNETISGRPDDEKNQHLLRTCREISEVFGYGVAADQ